MSEAELLADIVEQLCVPNTSQPAKAGKDAAAELRRLHAENEALRAQLGQGVPDGWRVISAARMAMDESFEAGNEEQDIAIPSHLAAALSMALDDYDAAAALRTDGTSPADVLQSVWNAMQNSADGDDLLSKLEHMRESIGRAALASAPPAPQAAAVQLMQAFRTSFAYDVGFKDGHQAAKKSDGCGRCTDGTKPCDITGSSCAADAAGLVNEL